MAAITHLIFMKDWRVWQSGRMTACPLYVTPFLELKHWLNNSATLYCQWRERLLWVCSYTMHRILTSNYCFSSRKFCSWKTDVLISREITVKNCRRLIYSAQLSSWPSALWISSKLWSYRFCTTCKWTSTISLTIFRVKESCPVKFLFWLDFNIYL